MQCEQRLTRFGLRSDSAQLMVSLPYTNDDCSLPAVAYKA